MKFKIEQVAICPKNTERALALLADMGIGQWTEDTVSAEGYVFGKPTVNRAKLRFNYDVIQGKEFEILDYVQGENWVDSLLRGRPCVSHIGMHCSAEELVQWREFFATRNINIAQEVTTNEHTNPAIAGKRHYKYVIFDTWSILGVDIKMIVRQQDDCHI